MRKLFRHPAASAVALVVTTALLLSACTPSQGGTSGTPGDTNLYMGELPPAATLPPSPELPPLPRRPDNLDDASAMATYNQALVDYNAVYQQKQAVADAHQKAVRELAATAAKGGKDAVAAWESLLVTAGIAVTGPDGTPVDLDGSTGSGWPMTDAELRLHSALSADPDGFLLPDLAAVLGGLFADTDVDLTQLLYSELQSMSDHDFGVVFWAVGPDLVSDAGTLLPADQVFLDWAQVQLLLRRFAVEAAVVGAGIDPDAATASFTGSDGTGIQAASFRTADAAAAAHRPCELNVKPWGQQLLNQFMKGHAKLLDKLIEFMQEGKLVPADAYFDGAFHKAGAWISVARGLMAYASLLAKMLSLRANYSLANAPLVRTKDTHPGEVRDLTITYSYDPGKWETVRECLNLFLAPLGVELPGTQADPPKGIDVELFTDDPSEVLIGDGTGTSTKVNEDETDADGTVTFAISGAAQAEAIPKEASPVDLTVGLHARNDLKGSNLLDDLGAVPWDAADAAESFGLTLLPELLARSKFLTSYADIPVRDWELDADFQVTAIGTLTGRVAYDIEWGCGTVAGKNQSTQEKGTFTTDPVQVSALLISNEFGNLGDQAFVFAPLGDEFTMHEADQSGVAMFPMPVHYTVEKSTSSPGTGQMPDHRVDTSDCGGVGSGGYQGDDTQLPSDCGARSYDSTLQVTMPKPRTLYAAGDEVSTALDGQLWLNCGDPLSPFDPVVAPWHDVCYATPTIHGGKLPSISDIADTSRRHFQVEGSFTCVRNEPGALHSTDYSWTLDFCRLTDGKPDC